MRFCSALGLRAASVALLGSLVLSGCGSSDPVTGAGDPATSAPTDNRAAAEQEEVRLLELVTPPAGASPVRTAPPGLGEPATKPAVGSLVDEARYWRLDMSFAQASDWLALQRPGGLKPSGRATASSHGEVVLNSGQYDAPAGPSWNSSQLQLAVTGDGEEHSFLRADGMVVWLSVDPVRDERAGRRVHLSAGDPCPTTSKGVVGVTNPGQDDLDSALVPAGTPTGGLLCRFAGLNGRTPLGLAAEKALDAADAIRLADAARRVPLAHVIEGAHSCPMDDARAVLLVLSSPGRPDTDLWVTTSGCTWIANGHISGGAGDFVTAVDRVSSPTSAR
jgi:hypothetical protein